MNNHVVKIQGNDYLKVAGRIAMFRQDFPVGGEIKASIETDLIRYDDIIIFKAFIVIDGILVATGYASSPIDDIQRANKVKGRLAEAVESAAVGRALSRAGYGEDDEEGDFLADSPIQRTSPQPEARRVPPAQDDKPKNVSGHVLSIEKRQAKNGSNYMLVEVSGGHKASVWSWSETFGLADYDIETDFSVQDGKIMPNRKIDVKLQLDDNGYYNVSEIAPKS